MKNDGRRNPRFDPALAPYETERLLRDFAGVTGQQLILVLSAALGELENASATRDALQKTKSLQAARRATERAQGLARNLRFYASQTVLAVETVELSQLLLDTIELVEKEFLGRGIQINVYAEAATLIVADGAALRQTFLNLLYTAKDSFADKGRITITLKRSRDGIAVNVSDNGQSIVGELYEVFEPHFNAQEATDPRILGLAVSKVLVEAMGGEISYKPGKEGGNNFHVFLPNVHKPAMPPYRQRRRFRRIRLDLPAMVTVGKQKLEGRLKVLGKGGCLLEVNGNTELDPNDLAHPVSVQIFHFERESIVVPKARIVDSQRADSRRGLGISFEEIPEKAAHIIAALVQGHTE